MANTGSALFRLCSQKSSHYIFTGKYMFVSSSRAVYAVAFSTGPCKLSVQPNPIAGGSPKGSHRKAEAELKLLKVAIIGVPNAGKSTLINRLMQHIVCPTSPRAHTTRSGQRAIMLEKNVQVVFLDTPGVINPKEKKRFELSDDFANSPIESAKDADLIAVMHSIENKILRNKLDPKVVGVLQQLPSKPSVLIVNKIDIIRGRKSLLDTVYFLCGGKVNGQPIIRRVKNTFQQDKMMQLENIFKRTRDKLEGKTPMAENIKEVTQLDDNGREVRGWPNFSDVFVISAKNGDGVESLKSYLIEHSKKVEKWEYSKEILTDCPPGELCIRIVKAKLLEHIKEEIPYMLHPALEFWDTGSDGTMRIVVKLVAPTLRAFGKVLGKRGHNVQVIQDEVEKILQDLLQQELKFYLHVDVAAEKKKA